VTNLKTYILLICSIAALYSCSGRRKTVDGEKLKNHSPKHLIDSISKTEFDYTWLRTKGNAVVNFQGEQNTVKVNFRIRKDSAIWTSISKSTIPLLSALLSEDSLKFLKKIDGKQYYLGEYKEINNLLNLDLNYLLLQDFVSGAPIMFDYEGKYKSKIENGMYLLSSDKSKKIEKLLKKGKGNRKHTILYRCWIEPSNFKCSKVEINFLSDSSRLEVNYSDWFDISGQTFPEKSSIYFITPYDTLSLEMKYSHRIKINEPQKMLFKVNDNYSPFELNESK
jgi:hypothetical protein|tara:strand:- start:2068 stop:2907 length:840 start_codon:yes stop_codon:yes gene_type:complete